jgi:hypothetical protein
MDMARFKEVSPLIIAIHNNKLLTHCQMNLPKRMGRSMHASACGGGRGAGFTIIIFSVCDVRDVMASPLKSQPAQIETSHFSGKQQLHLFSLPALSGPWI